MSTGSIPSASEIDLRPYVAPTFRSFCSFLFYFSSLYLFSFPLFSSPFISFPVHLSSARNVLAPRWSPEPQTHYGLSNLVVYYVQNKFIKWIFFISTPPTLFQQAFCIQQSTKWTVLRYVCCINIVVAIIMKIYDDVLATTEVSNLLW